MIVRDESAHIDRCLDAALPHVDGWFIVDTGSADDTTTRILGRAGSKPGHLTLYEAWSDYGTNRTSAAGAARAWLTEQGWDESDTYLLWLDADMLLQASKTFRRAELTAPSYELAERRDGRRSFATRLGRMSHAWTHVGVADGEWVPSPSAELVRLDTLRIETLVRIERRGERLAQKIALLERGITEEPENVRYWLSLANALADAGRHADALPWYEKRFASEAGEPEERFYARYRQGLSLLALGDVAAATRALSSAHELRPERAEPLVALARQHRLRGENEPAFRLALEASELMPPERDRLAVELRAYQGEPQLELSITAFYVKKPAIGLLACERLLADRDPVTQRDAALTARNLLYYLEPSAKPVASGSIPVSHALRTRSEPCWGLAGPNTTEYVTKNPAIVRHGGRVLVNVCLVNYRHERGRVFQPNDADGIVRTRSAIVEWDVERSAANSERESEITLPAGWHATPRVRGIEDQRWVVHDGAIWITATTYHGTRERDVGAPQVVLGRLADDASGIALLRELSYAKAKDCEKNWLPWSVAGRLLLIYSYDPFVVLEVEPRSGRCTEVTRSTPPWSAARWRGGAPPVKRPDGSDRWLMLVHETVWLDQATVYLHRFVELSATVPPSGAPELRIQRYSRLFALEHHGVEYACGALDAGDGTLLVTFGSEERDARWARFAWSELERMLAESPGAARKPSGSAR